MPEVHTPCGGQVSAHPDSGLLADAHRALEWWARQSPDRPTSSITGGGAVEAVERALAGLLGDSLRALALPNATFGLRVALRAVGVVPGSEVMLGSVGWPAAHAVVRDLGAIPVAVPIDPATLTMDIESARRHRSKRTAAAVAQHLCGLPCEVPRLREILGDLPIIEDCAQALGASLDGHQAGTLGTVAVFSLGPGKPASAGELGLVISRSRRIHRRMVEDSQHPVRQLLTGVRVPEEANVPGRAAPLAAVLGAARLHEWSSEVDTLSARTSQLRNALRGRGVELAGQEHQHPAPDRFPVWAAGSEQARVRKIIESECRASGMSARLMPLGSAPVRGLPTHDRQLAEEISRRLAVVVVEFGIERADQEASQ